MNTKIIMYIIAIIIIIIAAIVLSEEIKLIHILILGSGILYFGLQILRMYKSK